jgi:hypothetical protein
MKKWFWVFLTIIFVMYIIQKISVPSFESYKENAKMNAGQYTKPQTSTADNSATSANRAVTSSNVPAPLYDPIQKWGEQKVASAKKVMALAKQDCRIYEESPHLVVEMRMFISDINARLAYVRAIADSDVILNGQPRNIYFYDPSNKKIAQADTLNGVRLTN